MVSTEDELYLMHVGNTFISDIEDDDDATEDSVAAELKDA
jgi:hypothetical protein